MISNKKKRKVIFIVGVSHCGSTLLDLIMGSHSKAFSLGELKNLPGRIEKQICGVCADRCEFWDKTVSHDMLRSYVSGSGGGSLRSFYYKKFGSFRFNIYKYLMDLSSKDIMIDSSKSTAWVRRQLRPRWHWQKIVPYFVYLTRDGRAVTNSLLRKYPEIGMENCARNWVNNVRYIKRRFKKFPDDQRIQVSYEHLATDPEKVIRSICHLIGEPYEPAMLRYWEHEHHTTGGNLGPRIMIFKYREKFGDQSLSKYWANSLRLNNLARRYYHQVEPAIRLDLRWKREMSNDALAIFQEIAGEVNRTYEFDG
jgi:hypothetical protein